MRFWRRAKAASNSAVFPCQTPSEISRDALLFNQVRYEAKGIEAGHVVIVRFQPAGEALCAFLRHHVTAKCQIFCVVCGVPLRMRKAAPLHPFEPLRVWKGHVYLILYAPATGKP